MHIATTHTLAEREITATLGLVHGEAVAGTHVGRDILAALRSFFGGRSRGYETALRETRDAALQDLAGAAEAAGADAVLGLDMETMAVGQGSSMLVVTATGTAVKTKPAR